MTNLSRILVAAALGAAVLISIVAYSVFRTPAGASAPITAIPLGLSATAAANVDAPSQTTAPTAAETATTDTSAAVTATTDAAAADEATPTDGAASTATETAAASTATETAVASSATETAAASSSTSGLVVAQIVPAESEARFIIDEVLNGAPKTVVGTTKDVAGEMAVDPSDPTKSRVGVIQVNARTLTTDSNFRNRAIKNQILQTDQYEFITFTPTRMTGLPAQSAMGQSYTFQIVGNLTIRDVTKEVTFDVTATPQSATRLQGTAKTTIRYADYGITIPQVRQVASVAEQVRLEIDFVAAAT